MTFVDISSLFSTAKINLCSIFSQPYIHYHQIWLFWL